MTAPASRTASIAARPRRYASWRPRAALVAIVVAFVISQAVVLAFQLAAGAPIGEEIAFRGYLFPALTRWRGPWIGAILTALAFGAAHFLVYPLVFLPALAFFGFGACLLFWFTGSLLPSICLHAINNAIAAGVLLGGSWQVPLGVLGAVALSL